MARKVDGLGRIVLPVELRRLHGIGPGDALEIAVDGDTIVLRKLRETCVFCGEGQELSSYRGQPLCARCRLDLRGAAEAPPHTPSASRP